MVVECNPEVAKQRSEELAKQSEKLNFYPSQLSAEATTAAS